MNLTDKKSIIWTKNVLTPSPKERLSAWKKAAKALKPYASLMLKELKKSRASW